MRSLRNPWYRASVRRAASEHWLTTGSRGLRGMTGEPVELSLNTEAATVLAALVETTGWTVAGPPRTHRPHASPARHRRQHRADGHCHHRSGTRPGLAPPRPRDHVQRIGLVSRIGSFTWGDDTSPSTAVRARLLAQGSSLVRRSRSACSPLRRLHS